MELLTTNISTNDALILQCLDETGEEEMNFIAEELHEPKGRVSSRLMSLKKKGLVHIRSKYGEILVSLTIQGKLAMRYLWPEAYA